MTMYDRENPQHLEFLSQAHAALTAKDDGIPTLRRYWHDPDFRRHCDEEKAAHQAEVNERMSAAVTRARRERGLEL